MEGTQFERSARRIAATTPASAMELPRQKLCMQMIPHNWCVIKEISAKRSASPQIASHPN